MKSNPLQIGIVGVGLIGGSLGMSLRRAKQNSLRRFHVVGMGRKKSNLLLAKKRGAIDQVSTDISKALRQTDVVVICIPVHKIVAFVEKNLPFFKQGAIISDVGSVKGNVVSGISKVLKKRPDLHFVGGHPIAGSEKTGVANAQADLFKKATCVLTKDQASFKALENMWTIWSCTGAHCLLMTAAEHDQWLALTSHLPHLLAFALFNQVQKSSKTNPILRSLVGGSFRDMTRIAGADAELWTGVIKSNRIEIKKSIDLFLKNLRIFSEAKPQALMKVLDQLAREKRKW